MDVGERDTVQALMQALAVPDDLPRIVLINGQHATETSVLTDGDIVSVFPTIDRRLLTEGAMNAVRRHVSWPRGMGRLHNPSCRRG